MMDVFDNIYDAVCCELEEFGKKDKFDIKDIEIMDKLVDIAKDITEMGISQEPMGYSQTGNGYGNNSSYMGRRSYRMNPMYNRSYGRGSYGQGMSGGYSRGESKDMMLDQLEKVMDMAVDEKDRKAISRLMEQMENR